MTIGFVGMTHLGLLSAAGAAAMGFEVIGADPDAQRIAKLQRGDLPVFEPGLAESLGRHKVAFTADASRIATCDLIYVAPDVPVDAGGRSDTAIVDAMLDWCLPAAKPDCTVVVLSQVPPGFTRRRAEAKGRELYYQVETLIFGRALERAMKPERYIVGCADPAKPLPGALAAHLGRYGCPILPMRYESAELTKISINLCLVAQLSVTNTLAELCEHIGADWSEIAPALRLDARIGPQAYLQAGLGVGGGNLMRDVETARRMAAEAGSDETVLRAFAANSRHRQDWTMLTLHKALQGVARPKVAILGVAYKAGTAETLNSPGLALMRALPHVEFRLHDPAVDVAEYGVAAGDPVEACAGCHAVAVMTPWPDYRALDLAALARNLDPQRRIAIDPLRVLDPGRCAAAGLEHHVLGGAA
jgi:UDPglucose 6-dehydrogenase